MTLYVLGQKGERWISQKNLHVFHKNDRNSSVTLLSLVTFTTIVTIVPAVGGRIYFMNIYPYKTKSK